MPGYVFGQTLNMRADKCEISTVCSGEHNAIRVSEWSVCSLICESLHIIEVYKGDWVHKCTIMTDILLHNNMVHAPLSIIITNINGGYRIYEYIIVEPCRKFHACLVNTHQSIRFKCTRIAHICVSSHQRGINSVEWMK